MEGGLITDFIHRCFNHNVVVENQFRHIFNLKPFGVVLIIDLFAVFIDIDQRKINDRYRTFDRIAVGTAIRMQLL